MSVQKRLKAVLKVVILEILASEAFTPVVLADRDQDGYQMGRKLEEADIGQDLWSAAQVNPF